MLIDEATEELESRAKNEGVCGYKKRAKAMRLGAGALKRLKELRTAGVPGARLLLPGETEE